MNEPGNQSVEDAPAAIASEAPLVSVIIPAFNAARTIERALETVYRQTYRPIETIVVDDVSSDNTVAIVRGWTKAPVKLIERTRNGGPAPTRNAGIEAASGDYIAFLDADDEWLPKKIAKQVKTMRDGCTMLVSNAQIVSADGAVTGHQFAAAPPASGRDAWKTILKRNFVATSSVMTRKKHLDAVGGFDPGLLIAQDQDMWIKLATLGEVDFIDEPLVRYHIHAGSHIRRNGRREIEFLLPMIERHVATQRARLSSAEARDILAMRMAQIGRNAYVAGASGIGLRLILRTIAMGYQPLASLFFLVHASPPARLLKQLIRALTKGARAGAANSGNPS